MTDLKIDDGLIGFADFCQMRTNFLRNRSKHLVQVMTDDIHRGMSENVFRCLVCQSYLILNIRCDHAAGNGREYVIHQIFQSSDFFKCVFERREQAGIFDGDCGLICKGDEEIFF